MQKSLKEIADLVGGEILGDENVMIAGVSGIEDAAYGDITFLANPKYLTYLDKTKAAAVITSYEIKSATKPIIRTENPSLAFAKVVSSFSPSEVSHPKGIHPTAILGEGVSLGKNVAIGPHTVIQDKVAIGDNTVIYANCFVGSQTQLGKDCLIYSNVSIRQRVIIGNRVVIQNGTVIGSDGFGYVTIEGRHHRIPQLGTVVIQDDVEIGANVTIDRARFDKTIIGEGTKIDNLVHIAHNVIIGKNCFIVAQVGISGSTTIGDNVILAGQVGVVGHVKIGDGCVVMAQSGVSKSIPDGQMVWGYPAKPVDVAKRVNACVQNLPRMHEALAELKKRIEKLESLIKNA